MRNIAPRLYACFFLGFTLASCNVTKDLHKTRTATDSTTQVKTAITQTVTESIDTCITIPGAALTGVKAIEQLQAGDSIFEETPELEIVTKIDKGRIKTTAVKRPQIIPVKQNRIMVTHMAQDKRSEVKTDIGTIDKHRVSTGGINWNWLWLLILVVLIAEAWHLGWFKKKKAPPEGEA